MKTQLSEYKDLISVVKGFLEKREDLRDSDAKLVANVWRDEVEVQIGKNGLSKISAYDFFALYLAQEKLSSSDSITRARRKIQQMNIHLRGNSYNERQAQESKFRKSVNK